MFTRSSTWPRKLGSVAPDAPTFASSAGAPLSTRPAPARWIPSTIVPAPATAAGWKVVSTAPVAGFTRASLGVAVCPPIVVKLPPT